MKKRIPPEPPLEIRTMDVVSLSPGDWLVITYPNKLSETGLARMRELLEGKVPDGVEVLILEDGAQLHVIRPPAETTEAA